ncbi:pirin family protein [Idiomarina seosinensis]|uniref:pirin family protein n=1 Tax=Idiomarina seosinensis TaxID=281739 RepID=UPI00384DF62E
MSTAVQARYRGIPAQDGAGVKLTRIINQPAFKTADPFLMLDEFRSDNPDDYIAGFPPHPHRGFCTLTYMLAGQMQHKDSVGNSGLVEAGGVQWMKAAKGIIHEEMPKQQEGLMWGFQLWINLPAAEKLSAPAWFDYPADKIPQIRQQNYLVRVIAGQHQELRGPVEAAGRNLLLLDYQLSSATSFSLASQGQKQRLLYCYQGSITVDNETVATGDLLQLDADEPLHISAQGQAGFLLLAAEPIGEPVVQYGPFVMNTATEIQQAIRDYQSGQLAANQKLD